MAYSVTTSGLTTVNGSPANIVDGNFSTRWSFANFENGDGLMITVDTGGWFNASTLRWCSHRFSGWPCNVPDYGSSWDSPFPYWSVQISADGIDWFNLTPDYSGGVFFGTVGIANAPDIGNFDGNHWNNYPFQPWPRAEYFRYIRYVGVGEGVFHQYQGPLYINELQFFQSDGVTPIAVDTSGGANPNPPTGTADDEPLAPSDSATPANVSSASLSILRSDAGSVKVTTANLAVLRSDAGVVHVTSVSLAVLSRIPKLLQANFTDDAVLVANLNGVHGDLLRADFVDDAVVTARLFTGKFEADFTDGATLTAKLTAAPIVFPNWSCYTTGRA